MSILDLEITETSIPNYNDLAIWYKDFKEVEKQIDIWVNECTVLGNPVYKLDYIIGRIYNNNAYNICSDTHEPIEYLDFNYGSITCTISIYDRTEPELLPSFDGYIRRNGIELSDCYMNIDIEEIETIMNNRKVEE